MQAETEAAHWKAEAESLRTLLQLAQCATQQTQAATRAAAKAEAAKAAASLAEQAKAEQQRRHQQQRQEQRAAAPRPVLASAAAPSPPPRRGPARAGPTRRSVWRIMAQCMVRRGMALDSDTDANALDCAWTDVPCEMAADAGGACLIESSSEVGSCAQTDAVACTVDGPPKVAAARRKLRILPGDWHAS